MTTPDGHVVGVLWAVLPDAAAEVGAGDELGDDVVAVRRVVPAIVVDGGHMGARQLRRRPRLAPQPRGGLGRRVEAGDDLHRHHPVQRLVVGPPDLPHPARADRLVQPVSVPENLGRHRLGPFSAFRA
ncbi:MAG TPA: hypothetical protein VFV01_32690 [Spirillospora sp.]|nr:hypothetical protein [Spirillospora sp.]